MRKGLLICLVIAVGIIVIFAGMATDDCDARCEYVKKETARIQGEYDASREKFERGGGLTEDEAIEKVLEGYREYGK